MGRTNNFFAKKREWSKIKDSILEDYMRQYTAKLNAFGRPLVLIDAFAGQGVFEDGSIGSPLIICEAAEKYARGNYTTILINNEKKYHDRLCYEIAQRRWTGVIKPILDDSKSQLEKLPKTFKDQSVFLYLDPFGPKDCEFRLIEPFLKRNPKFSTEILITMNMPGMPRLAATNAVTKGRQEDDEIKRNHSLLTQVFGGDYWKNYLFDQNLRPEERILQLIDAYKDKLSSYLEFVDYCPVRENTKGHVKYFIVFASHHPHALAAFNDVMMRAYLRGMHKADFANGIWMDTDWQEWRDIQGLNNIILEMVQEYPGETRISLWFKIIKKHFMHYLHKEYRMEVQRLVEEGKLVSPTTRKTSLLNDDCTLFLAAKENFFIKSTLF